MTTPLRNQSEIARLREQIEREYEQACWAQTGLTVGSAKHLFISRRMEHIGVCQETLATLIGEQASMQFVSEVFASDPPPQPQGNQSR